MDVRFLIPILNGLSKQVKNSTKLKRFFIIRIKFSNNKIYQLFIFSSWTGKNFSKANMFLTYLS